jgi:hypothetical protein
MENNAIFVLLFVCIILIIIFIIIYQFDLKKHGKKLKILKDFENYRRKRRQNKNVEKEVGKLGSEIRDKQRDYDYIFDGWHPSWQPWNRGTKRWDTDCIKNTCAEGGPEYYLKCDCKDLNCYHSVANRCAYY